MKRFNVAGLCVPHMHYMVDISEKLRRIKVMLDNGDYFTINRARQYGKTTTLAALRELIKDEYLVISISFEGMTEEGCESTKAFCNTFMHIVRNDLVNENVGIGYVDKWIDKSVTDFISLGQHIKRLCGIELPEPYTKVVLMIDEVDKVSNSVVLLDFLGALRNKFQLQQQGLDVSFHSVVLASVTYINDIRFKMMQRGYNFAPWNIAVPFDMDMSFSAEEICAMLADYEVDHNTGMNISKMSDEIYSHTNGHPYLVSRLCQCIDQELNREWTTDGVLKSVKDVLNENNTLLLVDMFEDGYSRR